ncbi:MAG: tetratricopeptide repeat protein [Gammaproteobacteria bacterium]
MGRKKNSRSGEPGTYTALADSKQRIIALAQANQLEAAKVLASRICHAEGVDAESWFLLGTVHGGLQEFEQAATCFRRAIKLQANVPMAHYNLGIALIKVAEFDAAIASLKEAVRLSPDWADAHHDLGNAFLSVAMSDEAIASYRRAIALRPDFVAAHISLADCLCKRGQFRSAIPSYEIAVRLDAGLVAACQGLASALHAEGRLEEAAVQYRQLLAVEPKQVVALVNFGNLLEELGDKVGAETSYRAALDIQPECAEAMYNFGKLLQGDGNPAAAAEWYRNALRLRPQLASAHNNLGLVLQEEGEDEAAAQHFRLALDCDPKLVEAHLNLARVLRELGHPYDAIEILDRLIDRAPEIAEAHWNRSLLWLLTGDFERGWGEYEWRWEGKGLMRRRFPQPAWDGTSLDGRTVLVYAEQGVGDELMFASCFRDLISMAGHVVIDCDPRLVPLFVRSFPGATVHGGSQTDDIGWLSAVPPIHVHTAAGTVPGVLRPNLQRFPLRRGYLVPDECLANKWRERFRGLGVGPKIGISWRGGHVSQARKRSTRLDQWTPILGLDGAIFINLQYGDRAQEISELQQRYDITINDWSDVNPLKDLDDFAAQISALDLVISVDNSTVHMAGAVGVTAWVLQPFAPDWRWLLETEDSYWYPSVRQFRQTVRKEWEWVMYAVRDALLKGIPHGTFGAVD